jgi:hypothetical protein
LKKRFFSLVLVVFLFFLASACATPVGVKKTSEQEVYRQLSANALSGDQPSFFSSQFLERLSLADQYEKDPKSTLAELHAGLGHPDEGDRLFALAELSLTYARKKNDQPYFLTAALYAYSFLFPNDTSKAPLPYDPRLLLALVVYNRGITNGLRAPESTEINLSPRRFTLPFGFLDLSVDSSGFSYGGYRLAKFVSVDDFEIRGFRNRYRKVGIGAALSARLEGADSKGASEWIPPKAKVPITAFVRIEQPRQALDGGESKGTIELYNVDEIPAVRIGEYSVPLDFDPSVSLAYRLESAPVWDFEIAGFRKGNFLLSGMKDEGDLFFLNPYRSGRIPVVLVHGTASSPARWAEMANEFLGDPRVASRYQFWVFIYNSGNPIALSSMYLREGLEKAVRELDPSGKDPSLRQMVVIGHSQGGLLTKMTVVESGSRFWDARFKVPFEEANLPAETKDLLRRGMFVKPLPFVKRVIFIATPHQGSFLAENFLGKIARKLVSLPGTLTTMGKQLTTLNPAMAGTTGWRIPTSIDNMDWSNPFLRTLASLPIAEGVKAHSIIAVKGDRPPEKGNDGVVRYTSAHIQGAESELVVRSAHSCQSNPRTIEEVRRILYEHAGVQ